MEIFVACPRGFCAGVRRALDIVSQTLTQFGAPIYVRHEIVHNKHIIEDLRKQGVIFVDELSEVADRSRPVIFSAHGVSHQVKQQAQDMGLKTIDATCPLVDVVHKQMTRLYQSGAEIIVIGKAAHPEILGTVGQLPAGAKTHIIASLREAQNLELSSSAKIGIVTQTTLAVEDTKEIVDYLRARFNNIVNSSNINICFATTNRQKAIEELVRHSPNIVIIGSKNSSNSTHLKEAALHFGARKAWLIDDATELDLGEIDKCESLGISAGASAPEYLVEELIGFLKNRYKNVKTHDVIVSKEDVSFK